MKPLNAIELIFDETVNGFDIGLPGMRTGRNGLMNQPLDRLNGFGKGTVFGGVPRINKLAAIVGLKATVLQRDPTTLQMGDEYFSKERGIIQRAFPGKRNKLHPALVHGFGSGAKGASCRFNAMLLRIAHDLEAQIFGVFTFSHYLEIGYQGHCQDFSPVS
ncbi:MAG: hypothetical protein ONB46_20680 [candidate division KSB1 bacterium]|nr:hypothetical protein [candidate division KSB1 bacterium]MDZ7363114.1 hypothetical protein [candidate division KSB1 bacterium]MDZ7367473.1 hypothetical protein [candidate division KSB1 bacterium]